MHFVNHCASSLQNDFKGHTTKPENDDQRTGLIQEKKRKKKRKKRKAKSISGLIHLTGYLQHASVEEKTLLLRKDDLEC